MDMVENNNSLMDTDSHLRQKRHHLRNPTFDIPQRMANSSIGWTETFGYHYRHDFDPTVLADLNRKEARRKKKLDSEKCTTRGQRWRGARIRTWNLPESSF